VGLRTCHRNGRHPSEGADHGRGCRIALGIAKLPTPLRPTGEEVPADAAKALSVKERVLLFCAASDTYWGHAEITGEIVTTMIVKG
jgi:hypothetical protein